MKTSLKTPNNVLEQKYGLKIIYPSQLTIISYKAQ
jgi:hypothetical protein